jgi:hypothetical protein
MEVLYKDYSFRPYQLTNKNMPIRNKNCLWRPCLLMDQNDISNRNRGLSIDAFYQVSVHLAKQFSEEKIKKNRPIRNKNCLWRPCLLMDQNDISNRNRGLSIDASYQVSSVHLAKQFQYRLLISSRSINKHGHHRQFMFMILCFIKKKCFSVEREITLI